MKMFEFKERNLTLAITLIVVLDTIFSKLESKFRGIELFHRSKGYIFVLLLDTLGVSKLSFYQIAILLCSTVSVVFTFILYIQMYNYF